MFGKRFKKINSTHSRRGYMAGNSAEIPITWRYASKNMITRGTWLFLYGCIGILLYFFLEQFSSFSSNRVINATLLLLLVISTFMMFYNLVELLSIPGMAVFYIYSKLTNHTYQGHASPALIVSTSPNLALVHTDLSRHDDNAEYWAIRVVKLNKKKANGMNYGLNEVVTSISRYGSGSEDNHQVYWDDFSPVIVEDVLKIQSEAQEIKATFDDDEIIEIKNIAGSLPKPYEKGLKFYKEESGSYDFSKKPIAS